MCAGSIQRTLWVRLACQQQWVCDGMHTRLLARLLFVLYRCRCCSGVCSFCGACCTICLHPFLHSVCCVPAWQKMGGLFGVAVWRVASCGDESM